MYTCDHVSIIFAGLTLHGILKGLQSFQTEGLKYLMPRKQVSAEEMKAFYEFSLSPAGPEREREEEMMVYLHRFFTQVQSE